MGIMLSSQALADHGGGHGDGEASLEEAMAGPPEVGYYTLEPDFTTNLAGVGHRGRLHYLRIKVVIMLRDNNDLDEVKKRDPLIRDAIITIINMRSWEDATTPEGRQSIRQECINKVTEIIDSKMAKPVIQDVLFTNYLYQ